MKLPINIIHWNSSFVSFLSPESKIKKFTIHKLKKILIIVPSFVVGGVKRFNSL